MTHLASVLVTALVLGACNPLAASNASSKKAFGADNTAIAGPVGGQEIKVDKATDMHIGDVLITTDQGQMRAKLADNDSARALAKMLPLQIRMRAHLRQEKTGALPSALPEGERQADFSVGTLGLWGDRNFVIYYDKGRVPAPGIVILGQISGDVSQFDNPDGVTISLRRAD